MKKSIFRYLALVLLVAVMATACATKGKVITNPSTPPQTTQPAQTPADALATLQRQSKRATNLIDKAIKIKRALAEGKQITTKQELDATLLLQKVNGVTLTFIARLESVSALDEANRGDLLNIADEALRAFDGLNEAGIFGIKNPTAAARVKAAVSAVRGIISALKTTLQSVNLTPKEQQHEQ